MNYKIKEKWCLNSSEKFCYLKSEYNTLFQALWALWKHKEWIKTEKKFETAVLWSEYSNQILVIRNQDYSRTVTFCIWILPSLLSTCSHDNFSKFSQWCDKIQICFKIKFCTLWKQQYTAILYWIMDFLTYIFMDFNVMLNILQMLYWI